MEAGQFDDAPDQRSAYQIGQPNHQQQLHLKAAQDSDNAQSQKQRRDEISDLLRPSSDAEELEDGADDHLYSEEDEQEDYEADMTGYGAVEDADWELARGDFTKQFNRSRQLASAIQSAGSTHASASTSNGGAANATPLPAMNRRRRPPPAALSSKLSTTAAGAATAGPSTSQSRTASQMESLSKFASRVCVDDMYDPSSAIGGGVNSTVPRKALGGRDAVRIKDKADRATVEGVLDPRTMVILYKMVNRGLLESVNGCISTGKEANVYHAATAADPSTSATNDGDDQAVKGSLALKIYKTSILVFKDRDRYVSGEFRFRHGYAKHNPRKMVRLWAEKEARNLKRMVAAGLRAPIPVELRDHVLVMQFLGDSEGWASPRLKDADEMIGGDPKTWSRLYRELLASVRIMYHECRLVHADLSEYNILYHQGHLWIIDVSQSVEHDHPRAYDFLRADIGHVNEYFAKRGVNTLGMRRTFEFVVAEPKGEGQRKGGRAGLEKQDADFVHDDTPNPNAVHDEEIRSKISGTTATIPAPACVTSEVTITTTASGPGRNKVIGGGAWYTGLGNPSTTASASSHTGETETQLMDTLEALMHQLSVEPTTSNSSSAAQSEQANKGDSKQDEEVFKATYIPFSLHEVDDPEREIELQKEKSTTNAKSSKTRAAARESQDFGSSKAALDALLPCSDQTKASSAKSKATAGPFEESGIATDSSDDDDDDGFDSEAGEQGEGEERKFVHPKDAKLTKEQEKTLKKEAKKATKEANREKRKTKMPKAEKKRRMKKSHK
ncbi:related to RIO Kinase 1 [Melanopsichium pennsylvanicum]|uniref:Serine/threonine-protein kinase RIO1 n=2 Tax=Melanopsichium pennsylvanicum TaxID=63383 RepID=A0AAJ4XS48_9BASI|nr:related to RIO Kinase 1 [Melanopsichium pennsylvanicum 4]SNX86871.1 related to RIO Kinase 1 [Melanopsichium pennsylvanicum]